MLEVADYLLLAFLAIFGSPGLHLTNEGIFNALEQNFSRFSSSGGTSHWKVRIETAHRDYLFDACHFLGCPYTMHVEGQQIRTCL